MNDSLPSIDSRASFAAAVLACTQRAIADGARQIVWVDDDFAEWPLDEPALLQSLTAWLRQPQRRLQMLALRYEDMALSHPRFAAWRRDWTHAFSAATPEEGTMVELPTVLYDDTSICMQVFDKQRWRGRCSSDRREVRLWQERLDAVLQRSTPSFTVNPLGL